MTIKKRLTRNFFLTNLGIGTQVNSQRKANILNGILIITVLSIIGFTVGYFW